MFYHQRVVQSWIIQKIMIIKKIRLKGYHKFRYFNRTTSSERVANLFRTFTKEELDVSERSQFRLRSRLGCWITFFRGRICTSIQCFRFLIYILVVKVWNKGTIKSMTHWIVGIIRVKCPARGQMICIELKWEKKVDVSQKISNCSRALIGNFYWPIRNRWNLFWWPLFKLWPSLKCYWKI